MTLPAARLSPGTHFKGPLLAGNNTGGGLLQNVPLGQLDIVRSRYKTWLENFSKPVASAVPSTSLAAAGSGWAYTALNTPTTPLFAVTAEARCAQIDAGSKANSGYQVQNTTGGTTAATTVTNTPGPYTANDPDWDNQEMIWETRVGFISNSTTWDGMALLGIFVTDTSLLDTSTGLPTIASGGGFGFHVGITGTVTALGSSSAITAAGTATGLSIATLDTANVANYFTLGFRVRFGDSSTGVGVADYYVNGKKVVTISSGLPTMSGGSVFSNTLCLVNGAAQLSDLNVDYLYNACTAAGRTNTSL